MLKQDFPILEYDSDKDAFIRPERLLAPLDVSERAVICFFSDAIEKVLKEYPHKIVTNMRGEGLTLPVYEIDYNGNNIVLIQAIPGAPQAAGHIDIMTAYGCKKFIACGGCGVLQKDIAVGHLIIPVSAVRDEGTSYHYVPPSREISMNLRSVQAIEETLKENQAPYIKAKTWTTDAIFRETTAKIQLRKEEGCVTVEMEASAFMAVAEYNGVDFGQIFYAGDSLAGEAWDAREWSRREDIREAVLKLALDACIKL